MQARMRWWLAGIAALVVISLVGVLEPIRFRDRTDPDTGEVIQPLRRLGSVRIYRPHFAITLGLDLRGGSHLVLQAQSEGVFEFSAPELAEPRSEEEDTALYGEIVRLLPVEQIGTEKREVEVREQRILVRTRAANEAEVRRQGEVILAALRERFPQVDRKEQRLEEVTPDKLLTVERIIQNRVDAYGLTEPVIQRQRPDRIIVELPGVRDPEQAKELIRQTAVLEFRHVPRKYAFGDRGPEITTVMGQHRFTFRDPAGQEVPTGQVIDESPVIVTGRDLRPDSARVMSRPGRGAAVTFRLEQDAARVFEDFTRKNVRHYLAIVLDGRMVSCPIINEAIPRGEVEISGGFVGQEGLERARDLSILLNAGALPMDLEYVESRTVSAQLGQDALVAGLRAGIIGLGAVLLFMVAYYRLPGALAALSLVIYCILLLGAIRLVNQTLTLPGILAVILSIGMAVDASIIIFERLKEEIRSGKTMRSATEAAFKRAWVAILDANVCSIGTGLVLFYFGTGPIKGFAVALIIGVLVSLFTAVTVTRLLVNLVIGTRAARNPVLFGVRPGDVEGA